MERSRVKSLVSTVASDQFIVVHGVPLFHLWKLMLYFITHFSCAILYKVERNPDYECPRLIALGVSVLIDQFIISALIPTMRSKNMESFISPLGWALGLLEYQHLFNTPFNLHFPDLNQLRQSDGSSLWTICILH